MANNDTPPPHRHTRDCDSYTLDCPYTIHTHDDSCKDDKGKRICGMTQHTSHGNPPGGCWKHYFNCQ